MKTFPFIQIRPAKPLLAIAIALGLFALPSMAAIGRIDASAAWVTFILIYLNLPERSDREYISQFLICLSLYLVLSYFIACCESRFRDLPEIGGSIGSLALLGASVMAQRISRLREHPDLGVCFSCGYDLRGNESGTCPECGQTLHLAQKRHIQEVSGKTNVPLQEP